MEQDDIFVARFEDSISECYLSDTVLYTDFLSEREISIAHSLLEHSGLIYELNGGHEQYRRGMIAISAQPHALREAVFPFTVLKATFAKNEYPRHRDLLGAILGVGITRDCVGDILIDKERGYAVVFVVSRMKDYVMQNVDSAGRVSLKWSVWEMGDSLPTPSFETVRVTVASVRLDGVISAVFRCGRKEADELISGGMVFVNQRQITKSSSSLQQGDVFSVRGHGKCKLAEISGTSKKGRIILMVEIFQ